MRFIIYGAGAVGGVVGAQLHKAGEDVILIARGAHLEAIRKNGLRYETPHEKTVLPIAAVGHPDEIDFRPDDVVILTMKTQHTLQALEDLRAAAGDDIAVVCCQNGVANEDLALRRFENVYAMLVYLPTQLTEPGLIQCAMAAKSGVLDLCRYPGRTDALCAEIAKRFTAANFGIKPDPDVMRFKYEKLLVNLQNALSAFSGDKAKMDSVYARLRAEGEACYRAAGIDWATEDEAAAKRKGTIVRGEVEGATFHGNSTYQSLARSTGDAETDFLNGEICLLGRLHGVPTPANRAVQLLSSQLARTRGRPESIPIEEVERQIARESAAAE